MEKPFNGSLYMAEGIGAILVVLLHYRIPGQSGMGIAVLAKSVVPFFFLISGYFFCNSITSQEHWCVCYKKIKKLIKMFGTGILLYGTLDIFFQCLIGSNVLTIGQWFDRYLNVSALFNILVFNVPPIPLTTRLWFVLALTYCYVVQIFLYRSPKRQRQIVDYILIALPVMVYLAQVVMGFSFHNGNIALSDWMDVKYYRNWLFDALPFFTIGKVIYYRRAQIKYLSHKRRSRTFLALMFILMYLENELFPFWMEFTIGTVGFSIILFVMCIAYRDTVWNGQLVRLGKEGAMIIYFIHPFYIGLTQKIVSKIHFLNQNVIVEYVAPLIVVGLSIVTAYVCFIIPKLCEHITKWHTYQTRFSSER